MCSCMSACGVLGASPTLEHRASSFSTSEFSSWRFFGGMGRHPGPPPPAARAAANTGSARTRTS